MHKKNTAASSRRLISDEHFKNKHRINKSSFSRNRKLSFSLVTILILRKSLKSLQLVLNELVLKLDLHYTITASAFTQARAKLRHTAFIELNRVAVVEVMYADNNFKRYKGMRVLGIDGSKVLLPHTTDIVKEFGEVRYSNDHPEVKGSHAYGLASVMYDVLNKVAVDSVLGHATAYEVNLATQHLEHSCDDDLLLCDRNYTSYRWLSTLTQHNRQFVIRCSRKSFKMAREMLNGKGNNSQTMTIKVTPDRSKEINKLGLPREITVRFVRVLLDTGEYEVLVTNLLDEHNYPTEDFKEIYYFRWGIETFFGTLKGRLDLENFSGKTAESVYQDFYAMIYLSGLESIFTEDINCQLAEKKVKNKQQVNRAVSFNAIKNCAFEILYSDDDDDEIINRLNKLFLTNIVSTRENRKVPRKKKSARHLLNYLKRKRKVCF